MQTVPNSALATSLDNATLQPGEDFACEVETGPNFGLLLEVRAAILAKPETYSQEWFCGTAHCIAGHAVAIADPALWLNCRDGSDFDSKEVSNRATELLRLSWDQDARLCSFPSTWPNRLRDRYLAATTDRERAEVAADRIDHFIATGGEE